MACSALLSSPQTGSHIITSYYPRFLGTHCKLRILGFFHRFMAQARCARNFTVIYSISMDRKTEAYKKYIHLGYK